MQDEKNIEEEGKPPVEKNHEDDWALDKIEKSSYLPPRKPFFADEIYQAGAAIAAILAIVALVAFQIKF
jgi:hypothetical protein